MEAVLAFGLLIGLILGGMWVQFSVAGAGLFYIWLLKGTAGWKALGIVSWGAANSFTLAAIPLFVLMAEILLGSGLSTRLYNGIAPFMRRLPGGLLHTNIVGSGIFAAISGGSSPTAAAMSTVALPELGARGYDRRIVAGSLAAGGTLGILIPPSVILVIYGLLTETSIGKLFIAGIVPGFLGVLLYLAAVRWTIMRDPEAGPAGDRTDRTGRFEALKNVWAVLLLFFLVIGGLYGALDVWPIHLTFSPTEAAGMGAAGAFLIALSRGTLTFRTTLAVLIETAQTTAALFSVLIGAWIFSNFVNLAGLPEALKAMVSSAGWSPMTVMIMILLIYVVLGCVFESLSMLLLTVPIFFPLVTSIGFDPVWFGIIVVVVTEISLITPPVGLNVFVLKGVIGDVSTGTIFRGVTPFWVVDIIRLALLVLIPSLVLFLPNSM